MEKSMLCICAKREVVVMVDAQVEVHFDWL